MAPEQLEGGAVDARTDLFAFGAVLYEMATGQRAFGGSSQASVIAAILERDPPPVSALQPLAPAALDRVVLTCLVKDPDERWQTARDLLRELQWISGQGASRESSVGEPVRRRSWSALGTFLAVAAAGLAIWGFAGRRTDTTAPIRDVRFSIYPEYDTVFSTPPASLLAPQFALSPDGSHLAYVATSDGRATIWVRPLNALVARTLPGTEGAIFPFWAPDGRSLGFFSQGKLKTVRMNGGAAISVTDASFDSRGGTWASDGTMLINLVANGGLSLVSADGTVRLQAPIDRENGENALRWPSFLPDGRHYLTVARHTDDRQRGVYLGVLGEKTRTFLVGSDWGAASVGEYLLFLRGRTLMAQTLDLENRRVTGEPVPLLDNVGATTNGFPAFSVSSTGALAFSGPWATRGELVWFSRDGRRIGPPVAPVADYLDLSFSPDQNRLALSRVDPETNTSDIWILDLSRDALMTRLTSNPLNDADPLWSPDGSMIFFRSNRGGINNLYTKPTNGSRPEHLVFPQGGDSSASIIPSHHSRDGLVTLFTDSGLRSSFDVWSLSMEPTPRPTAVLQTAFNEYHAGTVAGRPLDGVCLRRNRRATD